MLRNILSSTCERNEADWVTATALTEGSEAKVDISCRKNPETDSLQPSTTIISFKTIFPVPNWKKYSDSKGHNRI